MYPVLLFFFFNHTATTEIYTLSLHDALPISANAATAMPLSTIKERRFIVGALSEFKGWTRRSPVTDRKSTRLNSSHANISYAVFCLKKKKKRNNKRRHRKRY